MPHIRPGERSITVGITPEAHRALRHIAADDDVSLSRFLKNMIHECIANRMTAPSSPDQVQNEEENPRARYPVP